MQLRFGNHLVKNNETLPFSATREEFVMSWPGWYPQDLYSVFFYNLSGPTVHYWVQNIPGDDLSQGDIVLPYLPPLKEQLIYVVDLFRQTRPLPISDTSRERDNFPLEAIVRSLNLVHVSRISFKVTIDKSEWTTGLNESDAKYCRAVVEIAAKQTPSCLQERAWKEYREGKMCYNPYAIAHKTVQGEAGRIDCGLHYIYENLPDLELIGFANLNNILIPDPYNRQGLIQNIRAWKD
jgi:hypothetical protein